MDSNDLAYKYKATARTPALAINPAEDPVQRVRSALRHIVGPNGLDLSEGLGRLVITTSESLALKAPGHHQTSPRALASLSKSQQMREIVAEQTTSIARALADIGALDDSTILRASDGTPTWMAILPEHGQAGMWRAQTFDLQGFTGHSTHPDKASAERSAQSVRFTTPDASALERIQDSAAFQKSLFAADLARRIHTQQITQQESARLLADYDSTAALLHSAAGASAQAFVCAGGEVMYLLADRIRAGTETAVFLHEIMHRYGKRVLGQSGCKHLVEQVLRWQDRAPQTLEHTIAKAARSRALHAANGLEDLFDEELLAYAVEEAVSRGVRPSASAHEQSAQKWLDQVAGTLRGIIQSITHGRPPELDAQALVDLSYAFAQLESPQRAQRILEALTPQEQDTLNGWINHGPAPIDSDPTLFSQMPPSNDEALQFELVKARYAGTEQWLKAPNGAKTQLSTRQWVVVRTPAFKTWFGDWEADPENASKAVDENGEPMVYYHGSEEAGFVEFNTNGQRKTRGTGAFFTNNHSMACSYSGSI
jgi:hypothetical protein